jgi:hypothetical protein
VWIQLDLSAACGSALAASTKSLRLPIIKSCAVVIVRCCVASTARPQTSGAVESSCTYCCAAGHHFMVRLASLGEQGAGRRGYQNSACHAQMHQVLLHPGGVVQGS